MAVHTKPKGRRTAKGESALGYTYYEVQRYSWRRADFQKRFDVHLMERLLTITAQEHGGPISLRGKRMFSGSEEVGS